jgi:hypothetical protein
VTWRERAPQTCEVKPFLVDIGCRSHCLTRSTQK